MIPILIPLGEGSKSNNDELRILLRSIDKNVSGLDRVFLITTNKPDWIVEDINERGLTVVELQDKHDSNKDANLFDKIHATLMIYDIDRFCFCADDNLFAQPTDLNSIPVLHNHRNYDWFATNVGGKWRERVKNTFDWALSKGINLPYNYECHAPQIFSGRKIIDGMQGVNYVAKPLTIYTAWRVASDSWRGSKDQRDFKNTYEIGLYDNFKTDDLESKQFVGYSDATFLNGLRERLFELFGEKSRYEK